MTASKTRQYDYSAHLGYLFTELPFQERFAAARDAGFKAVEHPAPYPVPPETLAGWLKTVGLPYVQFGLRSGDAQKGEKGIAIFPERREEFRRNVGEGLKYAEAVGVRMVHAMAGILPFERRLPEHRDCYLENLSYAADEAAKRGIAIIVEAMSRSAVPDYFLATADEAANAIRATGHGNIRLLLDIFHTANAGDDPVAAIEANADLLAHVHIADAPGRHEPGTGTIDFAAVHRALSRANYEGAIGCEYSPAGTTLEGLAWLK